MGLWFSNWSDALIDFRKSDEPKDFPIKLDLVWGRGLSVGKFD